jgi:hypothetical protein
MGKHRTQSLVSAVLSPARAVRLPKGMRKTHFSNDTTLTSASPHPVVSPEIPRIMEHFMSSSTGTIEPLRQLLLAGFPREHIVVETERLMGPDYQPAGVAAMVEQTGARPVETTQMMGNVP